MRSGRASGQVNGAASPAAELRAALVALLRARRAEIEEAVLTRVYGIADPAGADPAYIDGLRTSVSVALDYALEAIERGEEHAPPPPPPLLAQARMAARSGISLDTVLRRYLAGHALLSDTLLAEASCVAGLDEVALRRLLSDQAVLLDRLLAAVADEHAREAEGRSRSAEQRRAERVARLLAGEPLDTLELNYDLDAFQTGLVATGPSAAEAIRAIAATADRRLLLVRRREGTIWGWLAGSRPLDPADVGRLLSDTTGGAEATVAAGEPARGLVGWRLTHRQAAAALSVALKRGQRFVCYSDVALIAAALQDELLMTSLRQLFLVPLEGGPAHGKTARETLRAYLAAGCNASSAAARLKLNRRTVASRLQDIEGRLRRPLTSCMAELEVALSVDELVEWPITPKTHNWELHTQPDAHIGDHGLASG